MFCTHVHIIHIAIAHQYILESRFGTSLLLRTGKIGVTRSLLPVPALYIIYIHCCIIYLQHIDIYKSQHT